MTTVQTLTLADFLLARIAEDEARIYRADSDGEYRVAWVTIRRPDGSMGYTTVASDHRTGDWCANGVCVAEMPEASASEPIFDARVVLAECDAKRRIAERHEPTTVGTPECICCRSIEADNEWDNEPFPCLTLRALALPYADHPDYRPEWRP